MSGNIINEGEEYKIFDCSDKPVRIFSTLIECSVFFFEYENGLNTMYYLPLCSRCGKCCNVWFHNFFIKLRRLMDNDLLLLRVLIRRLDQVLIKGI
jgi:hypothetical protein